MPATSLPNLLPVTTQTGRTSRNNTPTSTLTQHLQAIKQLCISLIRRCFGLRSHRDNSSTHRLKFIRSAATSSATQQPITPNLAAAIIKQPTSSDSTPRAFQATPRTPRAFEQSSRF